jgi:hypothetical protein
LQIETLALDALAERVERECEGALDQIRAGTDPVDALWGYFMELPWEDALPALEELYELDEPPHFISWAFTLDSREVYRHAQVPKDYIRLFLLHVVVTRILRPDADPPDLRVVEK